MEATNMTRGERMALSFERINLLAEFRACLRDAARRAEIRKRMAEVDALLGGAS